MTGISGGRGRRKIWERNQNGGEERDLGIEGVLVKGEGTQGRDQRSEDLIYGH